MVRVGDHQISLQGQRQGHEDGEREEDLSHWEGDRDDVGRHGHHLGEGEEGEGHEDGDGVRDEEGGEELGEGEGETQLGPQQDGGCYQVACTDTCKCCDVTQMSSSKITHIVNQKST